MRFRAEPKIDNLIDAGKKDINQVPSVDDILCFWRPIVGEARDTAFESNELLQEWARSIQQVSTEVPPDEVKIRNDLADTIRKGKAWKACGPDGIPLYYWKHLDSARDALLEIGPRMLMSGRFPFRWLARGRTTLIFKKGSPQDPSCYRPITCLNTIYKIFTGVIRVICRRHFVDLGITPVEQRGLREGECNCLHVCMTDQVLAYDAIYRRHPLSVCWLDFKKAFDSVSHSYLKWSLSVSRLPGYAVRFISRSMKYWRTSFLVSGSKRMTPPIWLRNGIYQGDALSPELFVLAVAPISYVLNNHGPVMSTSVGKLAGFAISLNHQCYIDDFKLYGQSDREIRDMVQLVEVTASGIGISLNRGKCAMLSYVPGKEVNIKNLDGNISTEIINKESYTYLGITEQPMQVTSGAKDVMSEVLRKARIIFNSQLNW
uniref:Reverse transcriptase domain-containing protein n=1 Tax=Syphacia muris TaxID=451379 RepID=A0A0N5ACU9_9BILA